MEKKKKEFTLCLLGSVHFSASAFQKTSVNGKLTLCDVAEGTDTSPIHLHPGRWKHPEPAVFWLECQKQPERPHFSCTLYSHVFPFFITPRHYIRRIYAGARRWGAAWFCIAYFPTSSSAICCVSVTARIPSSLNNLGNAFAPLISSPLPNLTAHSRPRSLATPPLSLPSAANVPTPLRHSQLASGHWALNIERIFLSLALSKWQEWDVEILFDGRRRKVVFWQKCCVQSSILKQTQLHCKKDFFRRRFFFFRKSTIFKSYSRHRHLWPLAIC